jgi:PPK2 family polyphosphate:nucleotide phosphotransferase
VEPGTKVRLSKFDPGWSGDRDIPKAERKLRAKKILSESVARLAEAQERFYAADTWSLLLVFQAMDTAGKDGTIRHVMTGVNPQGCRVVSFKHPSPKELEHNFLWRYTLPLPERGQIGIFNRSYYEEVLVVRVHPRILHAQRIPGAESKRELWVQRYEDINAFERHLTRNGTVILKFFLNLSREEQRQRLLKRIDNPLKHWKFSTSDITERQYWDDYIQAYEEAITATNTADAPWHIVPADRKWVTRALVAHFVAQAMERLELEFPESTPEQLTALQEAKRQLESEVQQMAKG